MRRASLLLFWLLSDTLLFLAAYAVAYFLRVGWILSTDFPLRPYLLTTLLVAPAWLAVLIANRTFALMRKQWSLRAAANIVYAGVIGVALFTIAYYFLFDVLFSRLLLLLAMALSIVLPWAWHLLFGFFLRKALRRNPPAYPTLIIGATREAAALIRSLEQHESPLKPVAILDGRGSKESFIEGVPVAGKLNKLEEVLASHRITHMIQCSELEQSINLLSACRSHRITYLLLPSVLGIVERDERIESLEGRPVTVVRPQEHWIGWFFR